MNINKRISARALLAVASLTASPAAWSLGLGDATVESYLNQPLRARIDLITQESDDLASVTAKLASAADYELIGASLEAISAPIRFTVEDIDGDAYLQASSELPMNNPVIRLIVEVNWSSGRMLREYTLFLDPPMVADQTAPLPRVDTRETAAVTTPPPAVAKPETAPAQPAARPTPADTAAVGSEYGPVASGETLWSIAQGWSAGTGMNINQVMIAIQRENPDAFLNNNINLLKRGAILRMPSVNEVENISSATAYSEVAAQEEAFFESRNMASVYSPATPLLSDDTAAEEEPPVYPDPRVPAAEPEPEAIEPEPAEEAVPEPAPEAEPEPAAATVGEPAEPEEEEPAEDAAVPAPEEVVAGDTAEDQTDGGHLELLPPSEASELDSTYGFEESEESGDAAIATQALRENLARTEEELIAQQQQNEYLEERIRELEAQLESAEDANVADTDLADMEKRLREERLATQAEQEPEPWYSRLGVWLLGLLVLAAAFAGWRFSRRSGDEAHGETIQEIKDEAEKVLRVLEDKEEPEPEEEPLPEEEEDADEAGEEPAEEEPEEPAAEEAKARPAGSEDEASFLDEESSDPEIQLDLARAYISMGDKEAARVILEEVAANGTEEQQAEAQKMLDLI